jgi:hemoglobin
MPDPLLCTEAEVKQLVHSFYARVQDDPLLGPIFTARIADWGLHLEKMVDFWSSALRGTARYRGTPLVKHAAIPGLSAGHFHHWLGLFRETTQTLGNPELQARADELATRIAASLWYGHPERRDSLRTIAEPSHG